jgi:hypothetical protein
MKLTSTKAPGALGLWRKKPTYNEILSLIELDANKIQLPEHVGVTTWDSFAMGKHREMLQEAAAGQDAQA